MRYIDADKLIEKWQNTLKDKSPDDLAYKCFTLFIDGLKKEPTADVVPKSEVEQLKAELDKQKLWERLLKAESHAPIIKKAKQEVAREIFEEIENKFYYDDVGDFTIDHMDFQELKKKYTESEDKE